MQESLFLILGAALAGVVIGAFRRFGAERERRLFSLALFATQLIYLGFALRSAPQSIGVETAALGAYALLSWTGYRGRIRWVAAGFALHALWDVVHPIHGPTYVPYGYRIACLSFDPLVAAYLLWRFEKNPDRGGSVGNG